MAETLGVSPGRVAKGVGTLGTKGVEAAGQAAKGARGRAAAAFRRVEEALAGLPGVIRTDNGVPFATQAKGRISRLLVWWITLGIRLELIAAARAAALAQAERAPASEPPMPSAQWIRLRKPLNSNR